MTSEEQTIGITKSSTDYSLPRSTNDSYAPPPLPTDDFDLPCFSAAYMSAPTLHDSSDNEFEEEAPATGHYAAFDLRNWCAGQPPKRSFLSSSRGQPPKARVSRRNTIADKPELDVLLAATMVEHNGHSFLPLTAENIHRLSSFFNGSKPLADMHIFKCIVITNEINDIHADHVMEAFVRIGRYCEHLLVKSPVQTSDLGSVFRREAGEINPGNDWDHIFEYLPALAYLAFIHDVKDPKDISLGTFEALRAVVVKRQGLQDIKTFGL